MGDAASIAQSAPRTRIFGGRSLKTVFETCCSNPWMILGSPIAAMIQGMSPDRQSSGFNVTG